MTDEERKSLKAEIKAEIFREISQRAVFSPQSKDFLFNETRWKYTNNTGPGTLRDAFGIYEDWKVWNLIRQLSVKCLGVRYLRDMTIEQTDRAATIVDFLCQYVIEQRKVMGVKPND